MDPAILHADRNRDVLLVELREADRRAEDRRLWQNRLRVFRRREILRIGTRDLCLGMPLTPIVRDLSALADAELQAALDRAAREEGAGDILKDFSILAYGKLGGEELNYSSDIDILGIYEDEGETTEDEAALRRRLMERLREDLTVHTEEGPGYRVDLRLRPWGRSGDIVQGRDALLRYYREKAARWEIQALLKLRPVAGSRELGERFLREAATLLDAPADRAAVTGAIERNREQAIRQNRTLLRGGRDVKNGRGGIRDIEFLAQGLQLLHRAETPGLEARNTLGALSALSRTGVLPMDDAVELMEAYEFLRKLEHLLQIFDDRQIHALPDSGEALTALARRALGPEAPPERLREETDRVQGVVYGLYRRYLLEDGESAAKHGH